MIVAGYFNESECSVSMKIFMNETGLFDVFQEINGVEPDKRKSTHDNGRKCIDHMLSTEGTLCRITGMEIIECNEIMESDDRGFLTDVDFQIILRKSLLSMMQGAIEA